MRSLIARYDGREIDTAGDGFYATFDGPGRAIRAAESVVAASRSLGLESRAGVHTGECLLVDGKPGGIRGENGEEGVTLGAKVDAAVASDGRSKDEVVLMQDIRPSIAQRSGQVRGPLDVGE